MGNSNAQNTNLKSNLQYLLQFECKIIHEKIHFSLFMMENIVVVKYLCPLTVYHLVLLVLKLKEKIDHSVIIICFEILAADSMKPCKLKRHLSTNHANVLDKSRDFFIRKLTEFRTQKEQYSKISSDHENELLASYKVAYRVPRCKKPHNIAEKLILPAALDIITTILGSEYARKVQSVPVSNDTIPRRISDLQ